MSGRASQAANSSASCALAATAVLSLGLGLAAQAQDKAPIKILVGFPPGGSADATARLIADRMTASMGSPVLVENRPGAGGRIAAQAVKDAAPDGNTLMIAPLAVMVVQPLAKASPPPMPLPMAWTGRPSPQMVKSWRNSTPQMVAVNSSPPTTPTWA